jgi:hypothetical protein
MIWKVVIHLFLGTCDWVRALLKGDVKKFISNSCTIAKGKEIWKRPKLLQLSVHNGS